jgi:hypothetical protein
MGFAVAGAAGCDRPPATVAVVPLVRASELPAPIATAAPTMVVAPTAVSVATAAPETSKPEGPLWACDIHRQTPKDLVIYKRGEDRNWGKIRVSAGPGNPPRLDLYGSLLSAHRRGHVCAFVDADHAWVLGYYDEAVQVFRTNNGGRTWNVTKVPDPDDPGLGGLSHVELRFRDARHGKLAIVHGGGFANQWFEHPLNFKTSDGGRTWQFVGRTCRKFGEQRDRDCR